MPDVQSIPPISGIPDAATQRVLKPLVDGWELRNGASDKGFVTRGEMKVPATPTDKRLEERVKVIEGEEWFRKRYEQFSKARIVDVATGNTVNEVRIEQGGNVKAYASDGTATGLTLDLAAGATLFMNGDLTLRRNPDFNPYQWLKVVTDVKLENGALVTTTRDVRTIVDGDVSNGGWLFLWIEVKNLTTGVTTQHGRQLFVPHGAVFLKAHVHAVATCSAAGTYKINVVADGSNAKYGFGDIKGTARVPLSVMVC